MIYHRNKIVLINTYCKNGLYTNYMTLQNIAITSQINYSDNTIEDGYYKYNSHLESKTEDISIKASKKQNDVGIKKN